MSEIDTRPENLFVYGTLRCGFQNLAAQMLHRSAVWLGPGRVRGRLFRISDYPGLVPSISDNSWVIGDVFRIDLREDIYLALDKYEACSPTDPLPHEFRREIHPVQLQSGEWINAALYRYARDVAGKAEIDSGDFLSAGRSADL